MSFKEIARFDDSVKPSCYYDLIIENTDGEYTYIAVMRYTVNPLYSRSGHEETDYVSDNLAFIKQGFVTYNPELSDLERWKIQRRLIDTGITNKDGGNHV